MKNHRKNPDNDNGDISREPGTIDPDRSVIVVSDLHLGGTEDPHTSARFSRFLEYLSGLYPEHRPKSESDQEPDTPRLLPPQKFILLGDSFDLWDPRSLDLNIVFLDALIPIARLAKMDCDVVFVTGNHDEDIGELVKLWKRLEGSIIPGFPGKEQDPCEVNSVAFGHELPEKSIRYLPTEKEGSKDDGLDFRIRTDSRITIYRRAYIPGRGREGHKEGLNVGGVHYAFLHGHQFDPEQITYRISAFFNKRFDPVSVLMDYANTDLAKWFTIWECMAFLVLWIGAVICYFTLPVRFTLIFLGLGLSIFALKFLLKIKSYVCSAKMMGDDFLPIFLYNLAVFILFCGSIVHFFSLSMKENVTIPGTDILFIVTFWLLTLVAVMTSIPRVFAYAKREVYNWIKPRDMTIEEIAGKDDYSQWRYFMPDKYTLTSDVLIFGHTHCVGLPMRYTIPDFLERPGMEHPLDILVRIKDIFIHGWNYQNPARLIAHPLAGRHFYLINSGCWVRPADEKEQSASGRCMTGFLDILADFKKIWLYGNSDPARERQDPCREHLDTFVYIDSGGVWLMEWIDDGCKGTIHPIGEHIPPGQFLQ